MFHFIFNVRSCLIVVVVYYITYQFVRGDEYGDQGYPRYGKTGGLVDVDVRDTDHGKHVGVHVPVFYKMDLDKDHFRTGLGINVLEGLVKVRVKKDPFKVKDNVFVSVAGIPLWMQ